MARWPQPFPVKLERLHDTARCHPHHSPTLPRTRILERTHQHAPAPSVMHVDKPTRPIRARRPIHDGLCDAISLRAQGL